MLLVKCTGISSDITWIIGVGFVTVLARGFELMKLRFETQVVGKGCDKADTNVIYYEIFADWSGSWCLVSNPIKRLVFRG